MNLRVEAQGLFPAPPGCMADPWKTGAAAKKSPTPISELIHPAVCNFNIKNWLGFLKMLAIEIQLVGVLLGFISSRLYKQLVSDIPAFKNSVREPSVI